MQIFSLFLVCVGVIYEVVRYKIYTKTEQVWDAMLESINQARSSIFLEMYIFSDNTSDTHDFVEILRQKAISGIKVKIIFDSFGSGGNLLEKSLAKLKDAGVELFFFKKLFRYTHRKVLVIDESVAFIGGVNINKFFKKWHDLHIKIEGKIVNHIMRSFARVYKKCGGRDPFVLQYDKSRLIQRGKIWFFEHFSDKSSFRLNKYYRNKIDGAEEKISIVTPYFMPNRWVINALKRAAERGVAVEIVMPKVATNPKIANWSNYLYMNKLFPSGVKFFLTNEMIHSKLMIIDGKEGILGSQNVDVLSFDLGMESGIFFTEKKLVDNLANVVFRWKGDSVMFTPKMRNNYFFDHLINFSLSAFEYAIKIFNRFTI
ncbi:MAG: phosphatidylserine/phosphatidylglycerophosphate/cardiolipin synthase family protein [Patescibacteria group bacterium]